MSKIEQVWVIIPNGYPHSQSFLEIAKGFSLAFGATLILDINKLDWKKRTLVFGGNLFGTNILPGMPDFPANWVIYNGEQVPEAGGESPWFGGDESHYLHLMRTHEVWDYSALNVGALHRLGVEAAHVPVGWYEEWPKLPERGVEGPWMVPGEERIGVLMYGSINQRRQYIIELLKQHGVDAHMVFGVYGEQRDALVARSKVVLNCHYYPTMIHEIFRTSHLFANKVCVVSEFGRDVALEAPFEDSGAFVGYEKLVEKCVELAGDEGKRAAVAEAGYKAFTRITQREILERRRLSHAGSLLQ